MITAKGPVIWREKEDRGDPDLDCLGLGFTECQTYWYEVAADLYVVCEERRQGVLRVYGTTSDLVSYEDAYDLCYDSPGPRTGERKGKPTITERIRSPTRLFASGARVLAMRSPRPVAVMMPMSMVTKAMNGRTLRIT